MKTKLSVFDRIYIVCALVIPTACLFLLPRGVMEWLAWVATLLGLAGGFLNMRGNRLVYPLSALSVALYAVVSLSAKNYGEALLNVAYLLPFYIYATIRWTLSRRPEEVTNDRFTFGTRRTLLLIGLCLVVTAVYGYVLFRIGSAYPWINSAATAACASSCFLAARRCREQWYFWLADNVLLIVLWALTAQWSMAGVTIVAQNLLFVVNNVRGLCAWSSRRS